ncbi:MAG TPA: LysR family transcriptional regulator [Burkholderiaceae bacterium]|nr:LysR family transcriptional regulator [Burkholderiaceae bacterium]
MPISLEALELLDAIDRRGSFAAAAQELGRVPSALTYAVRRLEDELDVLLFDRSGHRAHMTQAGRALLVEGRHLLRAADDLERRVKRLARGWEVELRIAVDTIIDFSRIAPLVERFLASDASAAATRLRFEQEVLGGTWDALASGRVDLAIGASVDGTGGSPELLRFAAGCQSKMLGTVEFAFCVAPHHALAAIDRPLTAVDVQCHRGIAVGDTSRNTPPRTVGLMPGQDVLTVPTMQAKVAAQIRGLGAGWLPRPWAHAALARGWLIEKKVDPQRPASTLHAAWSIPVGGKALKRWVKLLTDPDVQQQLAGLAPLTS